MAKNKTTMMKNLILTLMALFALCFAEAQTTTIRFAPQWFPQAQFAGYYAALDQGFYQEADLEVKIIHPTDDESSMNMLISGKADVVSSFLMDGLTSRLSQEIPLVNIAQLSQHSTLMFVTKASSGIDTLKALDNKKVAIWSSGFDKLPRALLEEEGIDVEFVPIYNSINLFLEGGVDAMTVMYYNEYDQIINSGVNEDELNKFFFLDYEGFDIPEDGLYCLQQTLDKDKDALRKFVKASLKGWEYVDKNREYALDLVVEKMNKARLANSRAHQRCMLDKVVGQLAPMDKNVKQGHLLEADFQRALNIIQSEARSGAEMKTLPFDSFYEPLVD